MPLRLTQFIKNVEQVIYDTLHLTETHLNFQKVGLSTKKYHMRVEESPSIQTPCSLCLLRAVWHHAQCNTATANSRRTR